MWFFPILQWQCLIYSIVICKVIALNLLCFHLWYFYFSLQTMLFQLLRWLTLSLTLWSDKNFCIRRSHELYKTNTKKLNKKSITILKKNIIPDFGCTNIIFAECIYLYSFESMIKVYVWEEIQKRVCYRVTVPFTSVRHCTICWKWNSVSPLWLS